MAFKDDFFRITDHIKQKSEEFIDIAQTKISASKIEYEINKKKNQLGDLVYNQYKENNLDSEAVAELCEEIKQLEIQLKAQVPEENKCKQCNSVNPHNAKFCAHCGAVLYELEKY